MFSSADSQPGSIQPIAWVLCFSMLCTCLLSLSHIRILVFTLMVLRRSSLLRGGDLGGKLYDHNFFVKRLMVILGWDQAKRVDWFLQKSELGEPGPFQLLSFCLCYVIFYFFLFQFSCAHARSCAHIFCIYVGICVYKYTCKCMHIHVEA